MKIPNHTLSRSSAISKPNKVRAKNAPNATTKSAAVKAVDSITIAGIPEQELTSSVRKALTGLIEEVNSLRGQVDQLQDRLSKAEQIADHDPLLEISNRRAFVRDLNRVLAMAERYNTQAALVFIDLNNLKTLNDNYGHQNGDKALRHVAELIGNNIRAVDSFARLGGDEFGLLFMHILKDRAQTKMQELSSLLENTPFVIEDKKINLTIAYGIVDIAGGQSAGEILENADKEMYKDKRKKRSL